MNDLKTKIQRLKLVHKIAVEMNRKKSTDEILNLMLEGCLELTGASTGSVMTINEDEEKIEIRASRNIPQEIARNTVLKLGEGLTGWVALHGVPRLVNNVDEEPQYVKIREDLHSELVVPIQSGRKKYGVISIDSPKYDAFTTEDQDLLLMVAELAAQILEKEELVHSLEMKLNFQTLLNRCFHILEESDESEAPILSIFRLWQDEIRLKAGWQLHLEPMGRVKVVAQYRIHIPEQVKIDYNSSLTLIQYLKDKPYIVIPHLAVSSDPVISRYAQTYVKEGNTAILLPLKYNQELYGVLGVILEKRDSTIQSEMIHFLTVFTSFYAQWYSHVLFRQKIQQELERENVRLRKQLRREYSIDNIIGRSPSIKRIMDRLFDMAQSTAPVLLTGETGTGKEMYAKVLHHLSERRKKPFVSINCAAIPDQLLESELFGYRKGAFTGADRDRKGKFEQANGGTLFLDEIGEMSVHIQSKLLRALQEKHIEPLGADSPVKVDIRIIAATNRNLDEAIAQGTFRSDLYYRLNVLHLHLPPLKERKEDIPFFLNFFSRKYAREYRKKVLEFSPGALHVLMNYDWPGNIRELENFVERCFILLRTGTVSERDVKELLVLPNQESKTATLNEKLYKEMIHQFHGEAWERMHKMIDAEFMEWVMNHFKYNKSAAAKALGLSRNTLKKRLKELGLM